MNELALTFAAPPIAAAPGRRLAGLAAPYNVEGTARDGTRWRIEPGALEWPTDVPVFTDHDSARIVGRVSATAPTELGDHATATIVRTTAGDEALELAAEGLRAGWSVGMDVIDAELGADGVHTLRAGIVRELSIVRASGFPGATITDIAASAPQGEPTMTTPTEPTPTPEPAPEPPPETAAPTTLAGSAPPSVPVVVGPPPAPVGFSAPPVYVTAEPLDYLRPDAAHSFVRDAFAARDRDDGALARLRRFGRMVNELRVFGGGAGPPASALFAPVDRPGTPQLFPATGYRGDLYVDVPDVPRPLDAAMSHATINDATPFLVPRFVSSTGLVVNNAEGTNPAQGTIVFDTITITPKAKSGVFDATRELVDSSAAGVAIDTIVTNAMRQSYAKATEIDAAVALQLAGAGVDTAVGTGNAALLEAAIRTRLAAFPTRALPVANSVLPSGALYLLMVGANRADGSPLLPYLAYGSVNIAGGTASTGGATAVIAGVPTEPGYSLQPNTAVLVLRESAYAFESATQQWRWEEVLGPAAIRFALFGYYAAAILRKDGVDRLTGTITMAEGAEASWYEVPEVETADDNGGDAGPAKRSGK